MAPVQLAGRSASCGSCGAEIAIPEPANNEHNADRGVKSSARKGPIFRESNRTEEADEVNRKELQSRRKRRQRAAKSSSGGRLHKSTWWLNSLKFPFRTESLITIGVLSALYGTFANPFARYGLFLLVGQAGRIIAALVIGYFIYFLLEVLRTAAHGQEDLPVASDWSRENVLTDLFLAMGVIALCFLPWGAYRIVCFWEDRELNIILDALLLGVPMLYFPMALLSATIHHSFLAVNPVTVLRAIGITWIDYMIVLALISLGYYLSWGVSYLFAGGLLAGIAGWWGTFIGLTMAMHALGSLYRRHSARLGWIREGSS